MAERGDVLAGRFTVLQTHASARTSSTVLAQDLDGRKVLVRELRMASLDNWDTVQKLERRAEQYKELSSRFLPECLGLFTEELENDAAFFFVFEYVEGISIEELADANGPQPDDAVRSMLRCILDGLACLHQSSPPIVHGSVRPNSIRRTGDGVYRLTELPLPELSAAPVAETAGSAVDAAYTPLEQRRGRPVAASDVFSLGMAAVFMIAGKHPQSAPVYRSEYSRSALERTIDYMIESDVGRRLKSATELLGLLDSSSETEASPAPTGSRDAIVEFRSSGARDVLHVQNPSNGRAESLLAGFFLDLWVSKPWVVIIVLAALSVGPLLIPALIFWFHPKSRFLINRAYARFRDVTASLGGGTLSVSDQIKSVEFTDLRGYRVVKNRTGSGIQLEVILDMNDGKQHRFYMNSLKPADAKKIMDFLEKRIDPSAD